MARKTQQAWLRHGLTLVLLPFVLSVCAQETEYKMELGGGIGPCFYLGDANSVPFAHLSLMGGAVVRRIFNPRMCVKANLMLGHLAGNTEGMFVPADPNSGSAAGGHPVTVSFSRNVMDIGGQFEMNFWGYGTGEGYKGHSRITPYALAGVGLAVGMGGDAPACAALCLPVGVGVKYKAKPRLNVGMEWTVRFTTSDELDATGNGTQLAHPYGIRSVGLKNKDCYSALSFFVTYDMCPKLRRCNN